MLRFLPGNRFPSVAIDMNCSLMCDHCRGKSLRWMKRALTPDALLSLGMDLASRGGTGMLISGGFDADGRLGIGPFLRTIGRLSDETDLVINVHSGLLDRSGAEEIASAGVDLISLDLIGSGQTIREIYHLDREPDDYLASAHRVLDAGMEIAPHVTMGLHRGEIVGEERAIGMAVELDSRALILNALVDGVMPGLASPPVELMEMARKSFRGRLLLGCMYPRGRGFPEAAERLGFDGIVGPGPDALEGCCSLAVRDDWLAMLRGITPDIGPE